MQMRAIFTVLAIVILHTCLIAQSNKYSRRNNNPIIPDMIADPSIIKIGSTYYCYATTDGYSNGLNTSGPPVVWKSKDLINWSFHNMCFPSAANEIYWAPSGVTKHSGKYFLYPTVNKSIYVASAQRPDGPFKLLNGVNSFHSANSPKPLLNFDGPKNTKGIDAEVFVDNNGQSFLFWAQRGAGKLNADMSSLDTNSVININTKRKGYSEGPIMFKRKGIYYYLYTLAGHENYHYAYGYSSVSPLGPFTFPENDVIAQTDEKKEIYGPGHGSVFSDPKTGQYFLAYLEFGNGGPNRRVYIDRINFNADGTIMPMVLSHEGVSGFKTIKMKKNLALESTAKSSSTLPDLKIKPVTDPNLSRTEKFSSRNAIDDSYGTRWMADTSSDKKAYIIFDLIKSKKIHKTEAYFVKPTAGHAYKLEYSEDQNQWFSCGGHSDIRIQSPHTDAPKITARYLRLSFLSGIPGLWEFRVY